MPVTTKPQPKKALLKTTAAGTFVIEIDNTPQAGRGACKVAGCGCKQFVPEKRNRAMHVTAHQPNTCDACGHDALYHA